MLLSCQKVEQGTGKCQIHDPSVPEASPGQAGCMPSTGTEKLRRTAGYFALPALHAVELFVAMLRAAEAFKFECNFEPVRLQPGEPGELMPRLCRAEGRGVRAATSCPFPAEACCFSSVLQLSQAILRPLPWQSLLACKLNNFLLLSQKPKKPTCFKALTPSAPFLLQNLTRGRVRHKTGRKGFSSCSSTSRPQHQQ